MPIISGLYRVVEQQCTAEQVSDLLRKYRDLNENNKREIRVSGAKQFLIEHLQYLVGHGTIPKEDVYTLIQNSEENGHQHIYYYRPKNAIARQQCNDGSEVATMLFGEEWGPDYFPQFDRTAQGLVWSDFRLSFAGKQSDWIGKLYGHERNMRVTKREKVDVTASTYREIIDYEAEEHNTVFLVRWNAPGLLEIRIDQSGLARKRGLADDRINEVWRRIANVIDSANFEPWNLSPAITYMLQNRDRDEFSMGTVKLQDRSAGIVQFDPHEVTEDIGDDPGRSAAIDELLQNDAEGVHAVVLWKPLETRDVLSKELLTAITGDYRNCLVISSKTASTEIDYVTNQLRHFARG